MAVNWNYVKNEYLYTGLSTDERPNEPSIGSIFLETDTRDIYKYTGNGKWLIIETSYGQTGDFDSSGREGFNSVFGDKYVAHRAPAISANFNYSLDTRKVTTTQLNGATISKVASLLSLNSGTNPTGETTVQTKENVRYRAGREIEFISTVRFDPPVANNTRRYGLYDDLNGVYVGYENLEFGFSIRKNTVNVFIPQSDWNVDKCDGTGNSGFDWDFTKMNLFRLAWGYLGIAPVILQVYGGANNGWITAHIYDISNVSDTTHMDIPYLPIRASNRNNGNTTNVSMYSASVYTGVIDGHAGYDSSSREFSRKASFPNVTSGTDKPLIVFHNKSTYQGVVNRIDDQLLRVGLATEGTKTVTITLYKLASEPTGGTWADVDTANSNMRVNTTATASLIGAEMLMSWTLGKTDSINDDVLEFNLLLFPNEYAVFTYSSTGSSDVEFSNRWSERF